MSLVQSFNELTEAFSHSEQITYKVDFLQWFDTSFIKIKYTQQKNIFHIMLKAYNLHWFWWNVLVESTVTPQCQWADVFSGGDLPPAEQMKPSGFYRYTYVKI